MVFGCFYRSPTQSQRSTENCKSLNSLINGLAGNNNYTHKCFVGDFNFKDIEWPGMSIYKDEESIKKWNSLNRSKTAFYINMFQNPPVAEVPINRQQSIFFHRRKPNITTGKEWPRCFIIRVCLWTWRAKAVDKIPVPQGELQIDDCWPSKKQIGKINFYVNKNANVCVLWNIFKAKIHQLGEKLVPTSSNEAPFWKLKHWSSKINSWKGSPTQSLGKNQQRKRT